MSPKRSLEALPTLAWSLDPKPVMVGERTARFRAPEASDPIPPSLALAAPVEPGGAAPDTFSPRPRFARFEDRHLVRIETESAWSLYGTGEVAGALLRNGRHTIAWNTDAYNYDSTTRSLYQSHPWVLGVRPDGTAFGVLVDTTHRVSIDLAEGVLFEADGYAPAVYVIDAAGPEGVLRDLASLTGKMDLPPLWSLGYHQCRYSYMTEEEALDIAGEFRRRRIPCEAIWFDIDYMDRFRDFTFDKERFADPAGMVRRLAERGFRSVFILDPGIVADPTDPTYADGVERDHFVRDAEGREYRGTVWPGVCAFPDYTRSATRHWWADLIDTFVTTVGMDGLWNDMNEPAIFDGPGRTMPVDCIHRADEDLGGPATHARYHNVYGMLMIRATKKGMLRARPERRPFVLTRSNFVGGQRYGAMWTGDSTSTWDHLGWTIPMILNLGLSGQPFAGCDIGGFSENSDSRLFQRWMGIGSLLPFSRAHSDKGTGRHEPWSFGEECEHVSRLALERRYRLLPYLYTVFREAAETGLPVMRPLFFADPSDPSLRSAEDSFLLGRDVLVRASRDPENGCRDPMPHGRWRMFEPAHASHHDLPELFVREGAIVPLGPVRQFSAEKPLDPITLVISLDRHGHAEGTLYEDAGEGFGYRDGDYLLTTYTAEREGPRVIVGIRGAEGSRPRPLRAAEILILLDDGTVKRSVGVGGDHIPVLIDQPRC